MSIITTRQLRKLERHTKAKMLEQLRKDLQYLIKPKPPLIPNFLWLWLLRNLLSLNFK